MYITIKIMAQLKAFWEWFSEYQEAYYHLRGFPEDEQVYYFNELDRQLKVYHPSLTYVLHSPKDRLEAELILTANGDPDGMLLATNLRNVAPTVPNWVFTALIQPKLTVDDIKNKDLEHYKFMEFDLHLSRVRWLPVDMNRETYKYEFVFHFIGLPYANPEIPYEKYIDYLYIILVDMFGELFVSQHIEMVYYDHLYPNDMDWYSLHQLREFLEEGYLD